MRASFFVVVQYYVCGFAALSFFSIFHRLLKPHEGRRSFLLSQIVRSVLLLNHSRDADSVFLLTCASLSGIPAAVFNAVASSDCKLLSGVRETPPVPTNNAAQQSKPYSFSPSLFVVRTPRASMACRGFLHIARNNLVGAVLGIGHSVHGRYVGCWTFDVKVTRLSPRFA